MISLCATKVKTNICLVSVKLVIVLTTYVPLFKLITRIQYVRDFYLLTTLLQVTFVHYYFSHTTICYSVHNLFCKHYSYSFDLHNGYPQTHNRIFTQGWLNYYWLSSALSCLFIFSYLHFTECSQSRRFTTSLS